ncbi:MAG: respiratory nitrate reductase subunit gamma [Acidobacteriota bacterium]|nr:respiratory nitrate reductase subunit gamma [Acidobacteriota bacterium]
MFWRWWSRSPPAGGPTGPAMWSPTFWAPRPCICARRAPPEQLSQLHAIIAWGFWAAFPFGRLVHAWSIPLQYLGHPYILYRRRYQGGRRRFQPLS